MIDTTCTALYRGEQYRTGDTIAIPITHREQVTPRPSSADVDRYGQLIEPQGLWFTIGHHGMDGVSDGHMAIREFWRKPRILVVRAVARDGMNAVKAWKQELSDRYDGKTGLDLTRAVMLDGYTAIVTVDHDMGEPSECVLLQS